MNLRDKNITSNTSQTSDTSQSSNDSTPNYVELWKNTDKKRDGKRPTFWKSEKAQQPIGQAASDAAKNAKEAAFVSLPVITGVGVSLLGQKGHFSLAPLGVPVIIGGIVLDTVKAPFFLAIATEEAIRAGITKLVSLLFEKPATEMLVDRIFKSFLIRLQETATLLVLLGLEDEEVLNRKLATGDIEDLIGLTLLHTAYASRNYSLGLLLATNKSLDRSDCPVEGLALFDKIMQCKESINAAISSADSKLYRLGDKERELAESRIVCQWIKLIKEGKTLTPADKPDATQKQIDLVNNVIAQIQEMKLIGMTVLPESTAEVASHLQGPRK